MCRAHLRPSAVGRFRGLWGPQGYGRGLRILQGAREQSTWTRPMIGNALSSLESQAAWPRQGPPPTLAQRSPWKEATPIMPGAPLWADYPALVDRGGADMGDPDPAGRHAMREQLTRTQPPAGPTSLPMDFTYSSLQPTPHPSLRNPDGGVACLVLKIHHRWPRWAAAQGTLKVAMHVPSRAARPSR